MGVSENGYASNLQVYTGKEESAEKGLGSRVVKDLTRHLKDKHHHVFFDNFFTSVQLLEDLEKEGTYACGTARADRKRFPESLKKVKLSKRYTHTHTQYTRTVVYVTKTKYVINKQLGHRNRYSSHTHTNKFTLI